MTKNSKFLKNETERRWAHALILLSLDCILPLHHLMGLSALPGVEVRDICRDYIRANGQIFYPPKLNHSELKGSGVLTIIDSCLGDSAVQTISKWMENIYGEAPNDHLNSLLWDEVLSFASRDQHRWEGLHLPNSLEYEARSRYLRRSEKNEFESIWERQERERLSDWDAQLYEVFKWGNAKSEILFGPESWSYLIVSVASRYSYWSWLLMQLTPVQIETVFKAAQVIVNTTDNLQSVGKLPHPKAIFDFVGH